MHAGNRSTPDYSCTVDFHTSSPSWQLLGCAFAILILLSSQLGCMAERTLNPTPTSTASASHVAPTRSVRPTRPTRPARHNPPARPTPPARPAPGLTAGTISVSPHSAILKPGQSQRFTPTLTGDNVGSVNWKVNGVAGGDGSVGTISSNGVYTAPTALPGHSFIVTITATSSADSSKSASSSATVVSGAGTIRDVTSYGATGNGTTDDSPAMNTAIAALLPHDTLYFPCGTYLIGTALTTISQSHISIVGSSVGCVTLKLSSNSSFPGIHLNGSGLSLPQNLIADTTANSFTLGPGGMAALGISSGDYVLISDRGLASNGPGSPLISNQQTVKIVSANGDTATIEGSFSHPFTMVSPYPNLQGCCPYAQKIINPVDGALLSNLSIDASQNTGADTIGALVGYLVNSEIGFLNLSNFMGNGSSGGLVMDTGYRNSVHDINCYACGNGGPKSNYSTKIQRQSYDTVQNVKITNTAAQNVFSFVVHESHNSTISSVVVDAGGANGRPFKLQRSSHNTFNNVVAKNGAGGHNGISITDISQYNTFNSCVALNNSNAGILLFGNHNEHNTFNNCTSMFNQSSQFGQVSDANGTFADFYTTVNGGTFCCARNAATILQINSADFSMSTADVHDDDGLAIDGLVINAANAVVENSKFFGLPAGRDIYIDSAPNVVLRGNSVADGTSPSGLQ